MRHRLGYWIALISILAVCGVLLSAFAVQFLGREFPCPLCILQRMAMLLCALGPAHILLRLRAGSIDAHDFATGYGMSVVAAVAGAIIAARQVLLHIVPPDPGFGEPVLGLHLYTWSLIIFGVVLVVSGLNLIFTRELVPQETGPTRTIMFVLTLLGAVILGNALAVFFEEGLHPVLPDNPSHYQLFDDLGPHS
jgi:disulfide bond formation protein DsbB